MIDLALPGRGRPRKTVAFEYLRDLGPADAEMLRLAPPAPRALPALKKIRDSHHAIARLIASGRSQVETAAITGYTKERVYTLTKDPAFQELVSFYSADVTAAQADLTLRMQNLSLDVIQEMQDRFESDPDSFSLQELQDLFKLMADRSGHGPQSKSTANVNIQVNVAERLQAARERMKLIDADVVEPGARPRFALEASDVE